MSQPNCPRFLNVDLVISSAKNLTPLADFFDKCVSVLFCEYVDEKTFELILEVAPRGRKKETPEHYIRYFLELFKTIPDKLSGFWNSRSSLLFDIGFDSGIMPPTYPAPTKTRLNLYYDSISPKILGQVAKLKGSIGITIYPYHPDSSPDAKQEPIACE